MRNRAKFAGLAAVTAGLAIFAVGCGAPSTAPSPSTMPSYMANGSMSMNNTNMGNTKTSTPTGNSTATPAATTQNTLHEQSVSLTVLPGGRLGSDGKMHDTFAPANFAVTAGVPVKLTIYNYDSGSHSLTAPNLNLNVQAKGSPKSGVPGITTVTFTPAKAGDYNWQCMDPCDSEAGGWAMSHPGYMEGTIHVAAPSDTQRVYLTIKDGLQFASADGKLHDSYSPASFNVQAGIPVQVTVENFDTGQHSFTSPALGVNQVFPGATNAGQPSTTTFTFTPTKAGQYHWQCIIQCDGNGWAMSHDGYMSGTVTVNN